MAFYTSIFWDTKVFITENPNIADPSWNSLVNIWTFKAHPTEALYIPLFYTSFWIEKFLGFSENISHISNLLLHLINCFLAYKIMEYICKSFAVKYIVILLFAFHPMQVESVVWLMGRKDLLMTTFTFLSILCFLNNKMSQPALRYLLTSIFLTFALLCKPSVISIIPLFVIIECLRTKSIKKSSWTLILVFLGFAFYHIQQNNPYIFQGTGFKFYQAPYLTWHFISRFFLINSSEPMYLWYKRSASGVILGYILTLSIIGYILYSLKKKKWSENSKYGDRVSCIFPFLHKN